MPSAPDGLVPHVVSDEATPSSYPIHWHVPGASKWSCELSLPQLPKPLQVCPPALSFSHFLLDISALLGSMRDETILQAFPTHCPTQGADTSVLCLQILKTVWSSIVSHLHVLTTGVNQGSHCFLETPRSVWLSLLPAPALEILFWFIFLWLSFFFLMPGSRYSMLRKTQAL